MQVLPCHMWVAVLLQLGQRQLNMAMNTIVGRCDTCKKDMLARDCIIAFKYDGAHQDITVTDILFNHRGPCDYQKSFASAGAAYGKKWPETTRRVFKNAKFKNSQHKNRLELVLRKAES